MPGLADRENEKGFGGQAGGGTRGSSGHSPSGTENTGWRDSEGGSAKEMLARFSGYFERNPDKKPSINTTVEDYTSEFEDNDSQYAGEFGDTVHSEQNDEQANENTRQGNIDNRSFDDGLAAGIQGFMARTLGASSADNLNDSVGKDLKNSGNAGWNTERHNRDYSAGNAKGTAASMIGWLAPTAGQVAELAAKRKTGNFYHDQGVKEAMDAGIGPASLGLGLLGPVGMGVGMVSDLALKGSLNPTGSTSSVKTGDGSYESKASLPSPEQSYQAAINQFEQLAQKKIIPSSGVSDSYQQGLLQYFNRY